MENSNAVRERLLDLAQSLEDRAVKDGNSKLHVVRREGLLRESIARDIRDALAEALADRLDAGDGALREEEMLVGRIAMRTYHTGRPLGDELSLACKALDLRQRAALAGSPEPAATCPACGRGDGFMDLEYPCFDSFHGAAGEVAG